MSISKDKNVINMSSYRKNLGRQETILPSSNSTSLTEIGNQQNTREKSAEFIIQLRKDVDDILSLMERLKKTSALSLKR